MPDVWEIMRAIRASGLPHADRHILMTLVSLADPKTGVIPDRYQPSLSELAHDTGLGRSTVARRMPFIETAGWIKRAAPTKEAAWKNKEKNSYTLFIPVSTSPTTGLVPERDQSQNGTSPTMGPGLVPERDSTSPAAGHEVPDLFTDKTKPSSSSAKPPKQRKSEESREDVERICNYLAEWIVKNGSKRPTIGEKWRDEARRLIDLDKRSLDEIQRVIRWCQKDTFWRKNILSMPKLREKYDQLRLGAEADPNNQGRRNGGLGPGVHVPYLDPEDQSVYDRPL